MTTQLAQQALSEEEKELEAKRQAAYALNLCTVSVSQIVDYNDIGILEQEYETILNNLNLEHMPKDEALLDILKRLLQTITFFRIQEGDKMMIDAEYQHKMKNAIWSAVPNLGVLVTGGIPNIGTAISLASQIGIGYMNYRKNKSEYALNRKKQEWQLQRSAMEQFDALRQQLFETAWRLSDEHHFPDFFRLTEKQVKQFNAILIDSDEIRKYERLLSVKDRFEAYPPFWYYLGNTANSIARNDRYGFEKADRELFAKEAREYFEYYRTVNKYNLLREDSLHAACNLELVDLLPPDDSQIPALIEEAASMAGNSWDILQLCAMAFLKNGDIERASRLLKVLVNEDYNAVVNAQILSSVYVGKALSAPENDKKKYRKDYRLLTTRVSPAYLFPLPEESSNGNALMKGFIDDQRDILWRMYKHTLYRLYDKYAIQINKIIPLPKEGRFAKKQEQPDDTIYLDRKDMKEERINRMRYALNSRSVCDAYRQDMSGISYSYDLLGILNNMFRAVSQLECVDDQTQHKLELMIKRSLMSNRDAIKSVEESLSDFSIAAYEQSQQISLGSLTMDPFFKELIKYAYYSVNQKTTMEDIAVTESALVAFCKQEGLPEPATILEGDNTFVDASDNLVFFKPQLLGEETVQQSERAKKNAKMVNCILKNRDDILTGSPDVEFFTKDDSSMMERYFRINKVLQGKLDYKRKILAVLDDQTKKDFDLLFTTRGIAPIINGSLKKVIPYADINWGKNSKAYELDVGYKYSNENVKIEALYKLIKELSGYAEPIDEDKKILAGVFKK